MDWIDECLEAVQQGLARMDFSTLKPIDCFDMFPLYAKEGTNRLLKIINKSSAYDIQEIARQMHSPSAIRVEMLFALIKAKLAGVDKSTVLNIAEFYHSLLEVLCLDDLYAKNGKNLIHTPEEINKIVDGLTVADPQVARVLGQLVNACYHLAYGLYSDINPQICYDNFGPYDVSDKFGTGHILVIKQFQNLRPVELWGDNITDLSSEKIRIYCVYKDVIFSVDNASHTHYKGDIINGLKYFRVEIDREFNDNLPSVKGVADKIGLKAADIWDSLIRFDFENAKIKYLEQRCYTYVHLCKRLGLDWRPTAEMVQAVNGKSLAKDFWPVFERRDTALFWRMLIDPRISKEEFEQRWGKLGT